MGFNNLFSSDSTSSDQGSFNYNTQQDLIKRRRAIADQMMQAKLPQGQMVPGGPNGFFVAPSKAEGLSTLFKQIAGAYLNSKQDDAQKDLDKTSLDEFSKQYSGLGNSVRDPGQDQVEAAAQLQRESRRGQPGEGDIGPAQATQDSGAQSSPVQPQPNIQATPLAPLTSSPVTTISPSVKAGVAAALKNTQPDQQVIPDRPAIADASGAGDLDSMVNGNPNATPAVVGNAGRGRINPATVAQMLAGHPAPTATPPAGPTAGATPSLMPTLPSTPMLPPMGAAQPAPQASDAGMTQAPNGQAVPNPFTGAPAAPGQAVMQNGQTAQVSNPDPYSTPPNQQQVVARLIALGRTGPEGQQIAQAQLNQMFASKNGRFSTTVHADPVNGGFVQVTTDSQTGQSQAAPIQAAGTAQKVLETKDTPQGVMERTAQGWRLAQGPGGQAVVTNAVAADHRAETEQTIKTGGAVVANKSAQSSIDSSLARLDRIEQLYKDTETGPLAGHLPNWTAKRQELSALLAQDIFAETRDAVAGAADAGGAPKMAQTEFKYMADNGGLSQNTKPEAAINLIGQQRLRLNALKHTLAAHAETLNSVAPPAQQSGAAPSAPVLDWRK